MYMYQYVHCVSLYIKFCKTGLQFFVFFYCEAPKISSNIVILINMMDFSKVFAEDVNCPANWNPEANSLT